MMKQNEGWDRNNRGEYTIQKQPNKFSLPIYELWVSNDRFSKVQQVYLGSAWWLRKDALKWPSRRREELTIVNRKSGKVVFQMANGSIVIDEVKRA